MHAVHELHTSGLDAVGVAAAERIVDGDTGGGGPTRRGEGAPDSTGIGPHPEGPTP